MTPEKLAAAGWTQVTAVGFTAALGPLWLRGEVGDRTLGFLPQSGQGNNRRDTVHGGALMTFADIALGYQAAEGLNDQPCVTAQLQLHFVSGAHTGEFVSCRAEVLRRSSQLIFVRGLLVVDDRIVASADGIWKRIDAKPHA